MRRKLSVVAGLSKDQILRHHTKVKHEWSQLVSNAVTQWMRIRTHSRRQRPHRSLVRRNSSRSFWKRR